MSWNRWSRPFLGGLGRDRDRLFGKERRQHITRAPALGEQAFAIIGGVAGRQALRFRLALSRGVRIEKHTRSRGDSHRMVTP
jgi:hypothetical protein